MTKKEVDLVVVEVFGEKPKSSSVTKDRFIFTLEDPRLNAKHLFKLAELLGTKDIDMVSDYYAGGCDTCDYGSYSKVEFRGVWAGRSKDCNG